MSVSILKFGTLFAGKYQLNRMGHMLDADVHMKSPFDPKNRRLQGFYDE